MTRIEKTVFISYRRTNLPWALAIFQSLKSEGYDVFFDYLSIPSGDFESIIVENIKARAHFVVILTPSALERCNEPGDWLRREIEIAMDERRNIVPLMLESFDFGSPSTIKALSGKLEKLNKYNGLRLHSEYFFEGMNRLRDKYLQVSLDAVAHPISESAISVTEEHQVAANEAPPVEEEELTAQTWFERGYVHSEAENFDEAVRCFTEAIRLNPTFDSAYYNRATIYARDLGRLDDALRDFDEAIRLRPNDRATYINRGRTLIEKGEFKRAILDYSEAIKLNPDHFNAYNHRGSSRFGLGDIDGAIDDYNEAIRLKLSDPDAYFYRALALEKKKDFHSALADYEKSLELTSQEQTSNQEIIEQKIKGLKKKLLKKKNLPKRK